MPSPVFIVDDSELLVELLIEIVGAQPDLQVCGTAGSGEEALDRLTGRDGQPPPACAIALVDIRMPGMNGIDLVRELSAARPELPCVMVSAHAEEVYVNGAIAAGAKGYVMKGNPSALLSAVRRVLGGETAFTEG